MIISKLYHHNNIIITSLSWVVSSSVGSSLENALSQAFLETTVLAGWVGGAAGNKTISASIRLNWLELSWNWGWAWQYDANSGDELHWSVQKEWTKPQYYCHNFPNAFVPKYLFFHFKPKWRWDWLWDQGWLDTVYSNIMKPS